METLTILLLANGLLLFLIFFLVLALSGRKIRPKNIGSSHKDIQKIKEQIA